MNKFKIKKGDKVKVITGRDRGKIGEVIKIIPTASRVIVAGVNIVKKHTKPTQTSEGGIISKELSMHISNVAFYDEKLAETSKVGYKIENGKKSRFVKKSGEIIAKEGK